MLVVTPAMPVNNLQDFIAYAKSRPGQLSFASSGIGANTHLSAEQFNLMVGTKMNHIPYKGSGVLVTDLISGRVDLSFQVPITVISYITSGRMTMAGGHAVPSDKPGLGIDWDWKAIEKKRTGTPALVR